MKIITSLLLLIFAISCSEDHSIINEDETRPATICSFEESDSFDLLGVEVVDQKVNIVVRYGGGCENHEFCLIWPEVITAIYPPNFSVTLHHKSNDDPCYALITETISFDPDESNLKLSKDAIDNMRITVVNGSDESQFVSNK